ncbi:hypothetical protein D3C81_1777240 [compost metagenome]
MGRAEDGVELLAVGIVDIQLQQVTLHVAQQLCGLLEECFVEIRDIHAGTHSAFRVVSIAGWGDAGTALAAGSTAAGAVSAASSGSRTKVLCCMMAAAVR